MILYFWTLFFTLLLLVCMQFAVAQTSPDGDTDSADDDQVTLPPSNVTFSVQKLFARLFDNYDKRVRPSNSSAPVNVELAVSVTRIEYLDEKRQTLEFHAVTRLRWTDPRLTWDSRQFDNTEDIAYASFGLWVPDILLANNADPYGTRNYEHTMANIYMDGQVNLATPSAYKVLCGMDFGNWPNDEQTCTIEFKSMSHDGTRISLQLMGDNETLAASVEPFASTNEWTVRDVQARRVVKMYECCSQPYHSIFFSIRLQRKEHFYKALILTPLLAALFSSWLLFFLPLDYSLKFVLGGIQVVFVGIFAMYLKHTIPHTVDVTPKIVSMTVEVMVMILVASAIQLTLQSICRRRSAMPHFLRTFTLDIVRRLCCEDSTNASSYAKPSIRVPSTEVEIDHFEMDEGALVAERNKHEWSLLAKYLNRIFFSVYIFVTFIILI